MLDIQFIRDFPDRVRAAIKNKGGDDHSMVEEILRLDLKRRKSLADLQDLRTRANKAARSIGKLVNDGDQVAVREATKISGELKGDIKRLDEVAKVTQSRLDELMYEVPNVPHESVPVGRSESENEIVLEAGDLPVFDFDPLPHWDLIERHGLVDFERGSKVTGAGFPFYMGQGARLQRALINFFLDRAVSDGGYTEMEPPLVVNADSAVGTGQLPDKEDMMYESERDGLYLIPTAEVPATNFHRNEILSDSDLPRKFCTYTPCFRREAGSYGKDVRGLNRLHQFDKVELVQFVRPAASYDALEEMRSHVERLLIDLELPYRRVLMCTGDMGFTQAKKYDLDVWSAGQERWLEVSSISNFEAFQARRMMIRYRPSDGSRPALLHTVNGSGLALPRTVAALLENNQQADRSIVIPEILRPYTGFDKIG